MVENKFKEVLVVEDDRWQSINIKKTIEEVDEHILVHTAENSSEAMRIAKQTVIDLFIFDINLNDEIDGFELAHKIRAEERYALTWMVFLTIDSSLELEAYKHIHCYEYITKPYKKENVKSLIKQLLISNKHQAFTTDRPFIIIETIEATVKIPVDDIIFIEARGRGIEIHTHMKTYSSRYTSLKKIGLCLAKYPVLVRTHRSFIVNLREIEYIRRLSSRQSEIVFIKCDKNALVSDKNRSMIEDKLLDQTNHLKKR